MASPHGREPAEASWTRVVIVISGAQPLNVSGGPPGPALLTESVAPDHAGTKPHPTKPPLLAVKRVVILQREASDGSGCRSKTLRRFRAALRPRLQLLRVGGIIHG